METKIIEKYTFQDPATKERYVREVHEVLKPRKKVNITLTNNK